MKSRIVTVIIALLAAFLGVTLNTSPSNEKVEVQENKKSEPEKTGPTSSAQPQSEPVSLKSADTINKVETESPPSTTFERQKDLEAYIELKTYVLPNEEQRQQRQALLKDRALLQALGDKLRTPASMSTDEQDAAVDLLIESLKSGDKSVAREVLGQFVGDQQIENAQLNPELRQTLAGLKGEVLYHWAAIDSEEVSRIEGLLPGPVSRHIWENVKEVHSRHLAESSTLK